MSLKEQFEAAVGRSQSLTKRPSNEELLELYALYKQATEGDVAGERPGGFDFKAIAKYDAWADLKGQDADTAMQAYVQLVERLVQQYA
ncbi:acyl-CoA-binding protein [Fulvivirgaceae bacterium PWU5]|jgi:acyl-CoA-binding protein|uniref:Acyl-CoA-binding protein n=1 Tax=Dawidia cretensis TaxID=2782350 RepID=A0AAP2GPZ6_9BACT|nr:acyl-CoA-binding protein [Dawidia cretensis]MBT1709151.1 acyl-CoA-binding protein [Dawidia cretensis]